jgi:sarcosine oxidase subunit alpha
LAQASEGFSFFFNNKPIEARPGDSIGAAMFRAGIRVFTRSFKHHRPRGLLCVAGNCPNCLMNVDGVPSIRVCTAPAKPGVRVTPQNVFPSLDFDVLAASQKFDWLMPVGWYYKTFTQRPVWNTVGPLIRKAAGLAEAPPTIADFTAAPPPYDHAYIHADVAVVGAGPAGLTAALAASDQGLRAVLIDDQTELGGHLRFTPSQTQKRVQLVEQVRADERIEVLSRSHCFGLYEDRLLGVVQLPSESRDTESLAHVRAERVIVATGVFEAPLLFENNDLVGVMLSSAVERLIGLYGIAPGRRAVIIGEGPRAERITSLLTEAGVEVASVVPPDQVLSATGSGHIDGLRTTDARIACDLAVVCGHLIPNAGLLHQAGARLDWVDARGAFLPANLPPNVEAVGEVTGADLAPAVTAPPAYPDSKRCYTCFCEDVTTTDLRTAIQEGFDQIETLKRYTTVSMGPCQGRMCQISAIGVCARETGRSMGDTGVTTSRPPNPSVSLGALAGPRHPPVRRSPLHHEHEALNAVWMNMGEWKRPRYYASNGLSAPEKTGTVPSAAHVASSSAASTSGAERTVPVLAGPLSERECVEREYRAVRERAGVVDVGPLGKIEVKGRDAGKLLDKVYTHRFGSLKIGRVRYAVICDETGTILDDGTISRLADEHYFLTTTTGNLEFVVQWLEWWLIDTGWDAHITNVTGGRSSINVAGPRAREVLSALTDIDLDTEAFKYMACRQGEVAGAPAILLRIGFVGEMGWEVHVPADYGVHVWKSVLDAGQRYNIRPFGVETQRVLRLEKKHVIVGVDTDALSNPYEADMPWVTKLDKPDFIGKASLQTLQGAPANERLIGFTMLEQNRVPEDGAAIVHDGLPVGRVTSARYSFVNETAVGLAWVKADLAEEGQEIAVRVNGKPEQARVQQAAFYDPAGDRLRM